VSISSGRNFSHHAVKPVSFFVVSDVSFLMKKFGVKKRVDKNLNEALDVLNRCVRVYSETKKFKLDIEYSVFYDSENFAVPDDKKNGKIIREKEKFYQEEMGNIRVINNEYEFFLNERAEYINLRTRTKKEIEPVNFQSDSLLKFIERTEKTQDGYLYFLKEGTLEKFEVITYADGSLKFLRNYYREKMDFGNGEVKVVTQVHYFNFNKNPKVDPSIFELDPYVTFSKKREVTAIGKYKNYYVLNQIEKL